MQPECEQTCYFINRVSLPTLSLVTTEGSNTPAGTLGDAPSSERSLRDALTKAEQIFAETQELALVGSWEWDIATGRLAWTAQTFRNFGEDPHSFIPSFENYNERLHPDDCEMMKARRCRAQFFGESPSITTYLPPDQAGWIGANAARARAGDIRLGWASRCGWSALDRTSSSASLSKRSARPRAAEVANRRAGFSGRRRWGL